MAAALWVTPALRSFAKKLIADHAVERKRERVGEQVELISMLQRTQNINQHTIHIGNLFVHIHNTQWHCLQHTTSHKLHHAALWVNASDKLQFHNRVFHLMVIDQDLPRSCRPRWLRSTVLYRSDGLRVLPALFIFHICHTSITFFQPDRGARPIYNVLYMTNIIYNEKLIGVEFNEYVC